MKKFLFGCLVSSAFLGTVATALAADLDPGAPPPPTDDLRPASYDWSGMYVGGRIAATCGFGDLDEGGTLTDVGDCAKSLGIHAGYNHQMDNIVAGVESTFDYNYGYLASDASHRFQMPMTFGIKGRAGVAIDNTLLYGSVGYVYGMANHSYYINLPPSWSSEEDKGHHGFTAGIGMEHALTDVIRIRAGYEYAMFNKGTYDALCCDVTANFGTHTFSVGASYAFSTY